MRLVFSVLNLKTGSIVSNQKYTTELAIEYKNNI